MRRGGSPWGRTFAQWGFKVRVSVIKSSRRCQCVLCSSVFHLCQILISIYQRVILIKEMHGLEGSAKPLDFSLDIFHVTSVH